MPSVCTLNDEQSAGNTATKRRALAHRSAAMKLNYIVD